MEYNISGDIQYEKVPNSRAIRSFTLKQIKKWIQTRFAGATDQPAAEYHVDLRREGSGHTYNCQIQVRLGNQVWVGRNYQANLHQALIQCLHQMSRSFAPVT